MPLHLRPVCLLRMVVLPYISVQCNCLSETLVCTNIKNTFNCRRTAILIPFVLTGINILKSTFLERDCPWALFCAGSCAWDPPAALPTPCSCHIPLQLDFRKLRMIQIMLFFFFTNGMQRKEKMAVTQQTFILLIRSSKFYPTNTILRAVALSLHCARATNP